MKKLSLIVPAYNEAENIIPFFERVCEVFGDYNGGVEVVFIDDGSRDETYERIEQTADWAGRNGRLPVSVRGISFSRNFGKEAAMLAGLRTAEGEYYSFIDADLQQDPSYVRQMADLLDQNANVDMVAAYQKQRREGWLQILLKNAFYRVINRLSDVHFENNVSDFRTFRRSVRDAMLSLTETNRFSKGIFAWVGFRTAYIPYEVKDRMYGTSSWSIRKLFRYAMDGIAGYSKAGLKLSFAAGWFMLAASVVWLVVAAVLGAGVLLTVLPPVVLFVASFQLFAIGLIGDYLGRTYDEVRHRPSYLIRRECGVPAPEYGRMNNTIPISSGNEWRKRA